LNERRQRHPADQFQNNYEYLIIINLYVP
jgi:hypothetical protein